MIFINKFPRIHPKLSNLRNCLESNQCIYYNRCNHKTSTLTTTFQKPVREENPYVMFWYSPLTICYHTQGQVSVSMNSDPINMIYTSQRSTKKAWTRILKDILETPDNNTGWINIWINMKNCIGVTLVREMNNNKNNIKRIKG